MACIKRSKAAILADINRWKLKLIAAEETLDGINASPNEKLHFDDNEGSQTNTKRKLEDQTKYIEYIEDKLLKLNNELCGKTTRVTHKNVRNIGGGGVFL